jgi:uncharacterized protein
MRHYIIDGHNVLHASAMLRKILLKTETKAYSALIMLCERFQLTRNITLTIIFDGFPPEDFTGATGNVTVGFSHNRNADSIIRNLIAESKNPRILIIVSNDHEIRNYARIHGCDLLTAEEFLQSSNRSSPDSASEKPIHDDVSVAEWLRLFNEK